MVSIQLTGSSIAVDAIAIPRKWYIADAGDGKKSFKNVASGSGLLGTTGKNCNSHPAAIHIA